MTELITQLKAEAYDLLVQVEQVQAALRAKNQEIVEALGQPQLNGEVPVETVASA